MNKNLNKEKLKQVIKVSNSHIQSVKTMKLLPKKVFLKQQYIALQRNYY